MEAKLTVQPEEVPYEHLAEHQLARGEQPFSVGNQIACSTEHSP